MKKLFAILAAVVCLCGCEKMYIFTPMKVTLASEGQTMSIETSIQPQTLDIRDYYGNGTDSPEYDAETGTYTATYLWLTATISKSSLSDGKYTLVLTAEKNTTGKARTLNYSDSMEVRQE